MGQSVEFNGEYYTVNNVKFNPKAYQEPRFPIWIAGTFTSDCGFKTIASLGRGFPSF